jgi:predicted enzyme related to lactoylglutathione lyase
MTGIGATHIDHIVISSNNSEVVAETFRRNLGIEIRRTMSRPGTGARLAFAKLGDVILEFAGPPEPDPAAEVKARLWGMVLAVADIAAAVERLRGLGYDVTDPRPAVQPGALIATVKSGTGGVPFALIQYNAIPHESPAGAAP